MRSTVVDRGLQFLAAGYLQEQMHKLAENLQKAKLATETEGVHQCRVASRRLRSGLRLFRGCFRPKDVKKWRKRIRKITRSLGIARDLDVQILFLAEHVKNLEDQSLRKGVEALLLARQLERARQQPRVAGAVERFERGGVREAILRVTDKGVRGHKGASDVKSKATYALGRRRVSAKLLDLLDLAACLDRPEDVADHHQMRIAAKRLRYTMEALSGAYAGKLRTPIKAAKRLQTILGDAHDCDVWVEMLDVLIAPADGQARPCFLLPGTPKSVNPGLVHLRKDRALRRRKLFRRAGSAWRKIRSDGLWRNLVVILDEEAGAPPAGRRGRNLSKYLESLAKEESS